MATPERMKNIKKEDAKTIKKLLFKNPIVGCKQSTSFFFFLWFRMQHPPRFRQQKVSHVSAAPLPSFVQSW